MGPFVVEFYETRDGQRPAEDFLDELDIKMRSKLVMTLKVLQEQGNRLREPYSKHLDDGIFEIRGKVGTDISRVMYFFYYGGRIILTNGFIKKTQKTPKSEIERAKTVSERFFWKERVNQMKTLDLYLNEQLKNEEFRKEWEENQPEMDIIRAMADARISQNLTQKELAERTGINQADISKLENGTRNPSLKLLKRLADGMGMDLKLVFTPKEPQNLKLAK
mgnify:CR=1 FL=1